MLKRISLTAVAITAAMVVWAGSASADSYCVAPATGCTVDLGAVQTAFDQAAAHSGADTVQLGAATYTPTSSGGFAYDDFTFGDPITIVGAGAGSTKIAITAPVILPGGPTQFKGLTIGGGLASASVSGLAIEMPTPTFVDVANPTGQNQHYVGFTDQTPTQVNAVTITSPAGVPIHATGIASSSGGTQVSGSTVTLGSGGSDFPSYGLTSTAVNANDMSVTGATIAADQPIRDTNSNSAAELVIDRSILRPGHLGIGAEGSTVLVANTLIDLGANANAFGIEAGFENANGASVSTVGGDGLTIVGSGSDQRGLSVHAYTDNTPPSVVDTATVNLLDTIIDLRGTTPIAVDRSDDADGTANVNLDYSSLDATTNVESDGTATAPGDTTLGAHNPTPQPDSGFGDFNTGVFRLAPGSALIDIGNPAPVPAGVLSLDGQPRVVLGKAGCEPRRDIGAYEFVPATAIYPVCPALPYTSTPPPPAATGLRAAALKKCKRKHGAKRRKCKKRALKLPV